jgi:CRISPR-associated protein Csm4
MNLFRIRFRLRGPYATPWLADTLYGHLCWAALRLGGQRQLDDLLAPAMEGAPVLVLSDGFPGDLLPRPLLPPEPVDANQDLDAQRQHFEEERSLRRTPWVTEQEFRRAICGERVIPTNALGQATPTSRGMLKNQINRLTATTSGAEEGGGLFEFEETFQEYVTAYALVEPGVESMVEELLTYLADSGYGKRKAVGYGSLAARPTLEPFEGFGSPAQPTGFVSLSTFVPARRDPTAGYWSILVKYGKLGEELAYSENPFKFPLLMLRSGAVFRDSRVREFYGRLVEGVNPRYDFVMQPAFSLPVPMRLPEGSAMVRGTHGVASNPSEG